MATVYSVVCDRCAQSTDDHSHGFGVDLCSHCVSALRGWLALVPDEKRRAKHGERRAQAIAIYKKHGVVTSKLLATAARIPMSKANWYLHSSAHFTFLGDGRFVPTEYAGAHVEAAE